MCKLVMQFANNGPTVIDNDFTLGWTDGHYLRQKTTYQLRNTESAWLKSSGIASGEQSLGQQSARPFRSCLSHGEVESMMVYVANDFRSLFEPPILINILLKMLFCPSSVLWRGWLMLSMMDRQICIFAKCKPLPRFMNFIVLDLYLTPSIHFVLILVPWLYYLLTTVKKCLPLTLYLWISLSLALLISEVIGLKISL